MRASMLWAAALTAVLATAQALAAPPQGACCLPTKACVFVKQSVCVKRGGTWRGPAVACQPAMCEPPKGACCFADGGCAMLNRPGCKSRSGTFKGGQVVCAPNPCPQPVRPADRSVFGRGPSDGACCLPTGSCAVMASADCATAGGAWRGAGSLCSAADCTPPTGACCLPDLSCMSTSRADCGRRQGGYQGDRTACSQVYCPALASSGACCRQDGSCAVTSFAGCWPDGRYDGGQACGVVACVAHQVACCLTNGACVAVGRMQCAALLGTAVHGSACGPRSCSRTGCDWNGDGVANISDLLQILSDFRDGFADYDGDGTTDEQDIRDFVGCLLSQARP